LGDNLQKVRKLYGKELKLKSSLFESYEAIWKIDGKLLIVGLSKNTQTKKLSVTSVTYCKQSSFAITSIL